MGTRQLIGAALLLLSWDSWSQTFPYFPPPNMTYSLPTGSQNSGNFSFVALNPVSCTHSGAYCPQIIGPQNPSGWIALGVQFQTPPTDGDYYANYFGINGTGDMLWETFHSHNQFTMAFDSSVSAPSGIFQENDVGDGPILAVDGTADTNCGYANAANPITAAGCGILDTNGNNGASPAPFLMIQDSAVIIGEWLQNLEKHWIGFGLTPVVFESIASANTNDAQSVWGDSTASTSTTQLAGPSIANTQVCNPSCLPLAGVLRGTSASIGGGALAAGACSSTATTVTGATVGMVVQATPNTYPGDSSFWKSYVSSANTVTTLICEAVAGTPTASTYNLRVIQ